MSMYKYIPWTPPPRRRCYLVVAFPASVVDTEHTLELKTLKIGIIARALAIHRVDEAIIYSDDGDKSKLSFVRDVLEYITTPPYLRKKYIPLKRTLRFVGVLPPLRTPSHVKESKLENGEYREALILRVNNRLYAYVGVDELVPVKETTNVDTGLHIVKIVRLGNEWYAIPVLDKSEIPYYWCFSISIASSLYDVTRRRWSLSVATSRLGEHVGKVHNTLCRRYREAKNVLVAFGSPKEGLWDIARREGWRLNERFDFIINFIPYQGVETVRTEEAIHAVLEYFTLIETLSF